MKLISIKIILILVILFCFQNIYAFDISTLKNLNSYVSDNVGVLSQEEKSKLEEKINEIRKKYSVEILTVIIKSTNGEDISKVGTEIGQKIGVGKKDKDNGLLVLIAINDRAWNISTGYGIEGVLPDLLAKRIGEKNFVLFKDLRYFDGIKGTLNDFDKVFSGEESIISYNKEEDYYSYIYIISLCCGVFLGIIFSSKKFISKGFSSKKFLYFFGLFFFLNVIFLFLNYSFFKGLLDYIRILGTSFNGIIVGFIFIIIGLSFGGKSGRGGSSGGGSSSGGFGGGSFGGGGASGKW